jgi:CRISPR-associated protein Cmr6
MYALIRRLFDKDKKSGARFLDVETRGAEQFLQACMADKNLRCGLQNRGALDFWDVFPKPRGDRLVVEIMTPHFGSYYQGKSTPHDSGAPIPVSFLAVPAKSDFDFHVVCHPTRLPESLQITWRELLQQAFDHAFEWVGFGAKTSVGYGAIKAVASAPSLSVPASAGSSGGNVPPAIVGATAGGSQTWPAATLKSNPGKGEITASFDGKTTAPIKGTDADKFRATLGDELAAKLKKRQELKGVSVEVQQQGNAFTLKGLAAL